MGTINKSGFKLGKFCQQLNLKIVSTFFNNPAEERWTWKLPDENTKNEIDYMITNDIRTFTNSITIPSLKFSSDHRSAGSTLQIPTKYLPQYEDKKQLGLSNLTIPLRMREQAKEEFADSLSEHDWNNIP